MNKVIRVLAKELDYEELMEKFFLWEGSAEKLLSKESVSSGKALDLANVNTALIFQIRGNFLRLPLQGLI